MPQSDDILTDPFHSAALIAFVEEARATGGWPESEATRRRATEIYERELTQSRG